MKLGPYRDLKYKSTLVLRNRKFYYIPYNTTMPIRCHPTDALRRPGRRIEKQHLTNTINFLNKNNKVVVKLVLILRDQNLPRRPIYNQFLTLINLNKVFHRLHPSNSMIPVKPDTIQTIANIKGQCLTQGAPKYIDKFNSKVFVPDFYDIIAFKTKFSTPQVHTSHTRDDRYRQMSTRVDHSNHIGRVGRLLRNHYGNPNRYDSRTFLPNIFTLPQNSQPATSTMNRASISPPSRLAIRHPAVTTRQLLPRDSAMINPEIMELDIASRPVHISFLVLSREATQAEKNSGSLGLPICRAIWDFPDPDTFYNVLEQVVNLLEPGHKRPGALITAAAAPEAMGLCVICIKNDFEHAIDFIRRAIRGATQGGTILETFPLDAFIPPTSIHQERPWTRGMKRYNNLQITITLDPNNYIPLKAALHGQRPGGPAQPSPTIANAGMRGSIREDGGDRLNWNFYMLLRLYSSQGNPNILINVFLYYHTCFSIIDIGQVSLLNTSGDNLDLINCRLPKDYLGKRSTPTLMPQGTYKVPSTPKLSKVKSSLAKNSRKSKFHSPRIMHRLSRSWTRSRHEIQARVHPQHQPRFSESNIYSTEEGTPTPPRVERAASTATIQMEVKYLRIILVFYVPQRILNLIPDVNNLDEGRPVPPAMQKIRHQKSTSATTTSLTSVKNRKSKTANPIQLRSKPEAYHLPDKAAQMSPAPGTHNPGKHYMIYFLY